jgi:hypothetical protein
MGEGEEMTDLTTYVPKRLTRNAKVMRKSPLELAPEDIDEVLVPYLKKVVASAKSGVRQKNWEDEEPKIDHVQLRLLEAGFKRRKL